jgi:hypothetical protein
MAIVTVVGDPDAPEEVDFEQLRAQIFHILPGDSAKTRRLSAYIDYLEAESKRNPQLHEWLLTTKFPKKQTVFYEADVEKVLREIEEDRAQAAAQKAQKANRTEKSDKDEKNEKDEKDEKQENDSGDENPRD